MRVGLMCLGIGAALATRAVPASGQRIQLAASMSELESRLQRDSFDAVADSVALALGADTASRTAWISGQPGWTSRVLPPFLERVRSRLGVGAQVDSASAALMARRLAARAAYVRWPPEGGTDLLIRHDPDVRAALEAFPRLAHLLKGTAAASR